MEERQERHDTAFRGRRQIRKGGTPQGALHCGCYQVPVGENRTLGQTGGAAGKLDQGRIVLKYVNPGQPGAGSIFQQR